MVTDELFPQSPSSQEGVRPKRRARWSTSAQTFIDISPLQAAGDGMALRGTEHFDDVSGDG